MRKYIHKLDKIAEKCVNNDRKARIIFSKEYILYALGVLALILLGIGVKIGFAKLKEIVFNINDDSEIIDIDDIIEQDECSDK
ncbi:hypothetical protein JYG23_03020 [Sedimentibacter sp. zth1]|uniref:hypothetical protein n=1 Tax=Sedimentibacter sp. zth1 TaxID=2816908 RepID=UPI001A911144|nr:hypothetical protein [Sedimentibacter sp. zth1]QSX06448.1 hypothetical protein JYG23_03020 [Sedimentibacter sp. zth1]